MQSDQFTLYTYFRSSTSWRVRIVLNMKGLAYQAKFIHLAKGEQKSEEYKKINPNAAVPALVLPTGQVLIESVAIIQYLQQKYPHHPLLPKDTILKCQIRGFCEVINSGIHPYQNLRVLQKIAADFNGDKIAWAKYWVTRGFETIQSMLESSRGIYCFGDQITMADIFFVPQVLGATTRFKISIENFPHIKEVLKNLQNQQAFMKAQPQNQPDYEA